MAVTVVIKSHSDAPIHAPGRGGDTEEELRLTLDAPRIVVGRSKGCEVQLPDPTVSARHATIRQQGGRNLIVDEGSTNGIVVGNVRLPPQTPRAVSDGELVRVGRVWLELRFEAGVPSSTADAHALARDFLRCQLAQQGEPSAARLEVVEGADAGTVIELLDPRLEYGIGRGRDAELALCDQRTSRRHATVFRKGASWRVRDNGSKQGSSLDGEPLTAAGAAWPDGGRLAIGDTVVVFRDPVASALAEARDATDVKMRPAEHAELPPRQGEEKPPELVEAPAENVAFEPTPTPAEVLELTPTERVEPRGAAYASVDLFVALIAVGLIGLSAAGLMYVLG